MDLVSIIVPIYNVEKYIQKCIDSILEQTYNNIEVILVDDGSLDTSGALCDQYISKDPRIKVYHKTNGGLSDARNYGLKFASGKYVLFIDGDDFLDESMVLTLYNLIKNTDTRISACSLIYEYECENVPDNYSYSNSSQVLSSTDFFLLMLDFNKRLRMGVWNKMYDISLFKDVKFPVGRLYEDVGTMFKLIFQVDAVSFIDIPLYHYLKRVGAITSRKYDRKELDRYVMTSSMINYVTNKYPEILGNAIIYKLVNCDLSIINSMVNTKTYDKRMVKLLTLDFKKYFHLLMKSNLDIVKKIQIILFLIDFKLYKFLFRCLK